MDYTKCWLEYPRIRTMEGRTLNLRNLVECPVGTSAGKELAPGLGGLYGMTVTEGGGGQHRRRRKLDGP